MKERQPQRVKYAEREKTMGDRKWGIERDREKNIIKCPMIICKLSYDLQSFYRKYSKNHLSRSWEDFWKVERPSLGRERGEGGVPPSVVKWEGVLSSAEIEGWGGPSLGRESGEDVLSMAEREEREGGGPSLGRERERGGGWVTPSVERVERGSFPLQRERESKKDRVSHSKSIHIITRQNILCIKCFWWKQISISNIYRFDKL